MQTVEGAVHGPVLVRACAMACPRCPLQPGQGMLLIRRRDMWLGNDVAVVLRLQFANDITNVPRHNLDSGHDAAVTQGRVRAHGGKVIRHIGRCDR